MVVSVRPAPLTSFAFVLFRQDEVGTFPNSVAFRIMEEDLGVPPTEVFDFIYPDPIASASIGQVSA